MRIGFWMGILVLLLITITFAGCVDEKGGAGDGGATTINIAGSSTVFPIAQQCAEAFNEQHEDIYVQVEAPPSGSGGGIRALGTGIADIADSSRSIKEEEIAEYPNVEFVDHVIALDGVAIIVSKAIYEAGVTELTSDEVRRIYLPSDDPDKITNWKDVGGPDEGISVNEREEGSGTRATFMEKIFGDAGASTGATQSWNANADVKTAVANANNAIGYVGLGYVDSNTPCVMLDGVEAKKETIASGEYPLSRSLHMYTNGEPEGAIAEFLEFVLSPAGQSIVENEGFLRVN